MSLPFLTTSFYHRKVTQYSPKPRVAAHIERMKKRQKSESRNGRRPHQIRTKFAPNSDQTQLLPFNNRVWYEPYANGVRLTAGAESATRNRPPFTAYILSTHVDTAPTQRHAMNGYTPRTQPTFFTLRHAPSPSNFLFRVTSLFASS